MPGRRLHNPKRAKSLRTYSIHDMAVLYGVHENTVRNWLHTGLEAIDEGRPILVRGDALNAFHSWKREKAKKACGPGEMYCLPCQGPRRPAGNVADYTPRTERLGMLSAICPSCDRMLFQRVNEKRLAEFRNHIEVCVRHQQ